MARLTYDRDKLQAAAAAFWSGGAFLYVPDGVVVEKPFQIAYVIDEAGTAQYAHTLAVGGANSDFRLREYDLAADFEGPALHSGAFELYLDSGARCRLAHLHDWGGEEQEVVDTSTHIVRVGRDGHCTWIPIHLGGKLIRQHLELATAEPGSDMRHRGIYFTEGHEHLDLFTVDYHEVGPTTGDTVWKGAATGASRSSYEGLIKIDPGRAGVAHLPPDALDDALPQGQGRRHPVADRRDRQRVGLARRHGGRDRRGDGLLHADARAVAPRRRARSSSRATSSRSSSSSTTSRSRRWCASASRRSSPGPRTTSRPTRTRSR